MTSVDSNPPPPSARRSSISDPHASSHVRFHDRYHRTALGLAAQLLDRRPARSSGYLVRHREHQLLRDHDARPLRADAVREAQAARAAVLPELDGALVQPRDSVSEADRESAEPFSGRVERQTGYDRD